MKRLTFYILSCIILSLLLGSCSKNEDIQPDATFTAKVDNSVFRIADTKTTMSKGITIIVGSDKLQNNKNIFVITIRGTDEGTYKQEYDYKTGVSVAQCGLTMKTISKSQTSLPDYFISYEGFVEVDDIDFKDKKISGNYSFRVKAIPESKKVEIIQGNFVNLLFK